MRRFRTSLLLFIVLLAGQGLAQQHPNIERGLMPDKSYQLGEVDAVSIFTGGVNVSIPLGLRYPVNGNLSYQFAASYATNQWSVGDHETITYVDYPPYMHKSWTHWSYPQRRMNAGFSWVLTFGDLYFSAESGRWTYRSQDGAEHAFYQRLHANNPSEVYTYAGSDPKSVLYSRDGTYLRLKEYNSGLREVQFSNGDVYEFEPAGPNGTRLTKMRDSVGNWVSIVYSVRPTGEFSGSSVWYVSDSTGRTHTVYFRPAPAYVEDTYNAEQPHEMVDYLDLAAFNGTRSTYTFEYEDDGSSSAPSVLVSRRCPHTETELAETVRVAMLSKILLPEGLYYEMTYDHGSQQYCSQLYPGGSGSSSGNLTKLRLTTGATVNYQYSVYDFPSTSAFELDPVSGDWAETTYYSHLPGVSRRTVKDADGVTTLSETEYEVDRYVQTGPERAQRRIVRSRDRGSILQEERHYFSTCVVVDCGDILEYGLPITREGMPADGPFLSVETMIPGTQTVARSRYLTYEGDGKLTGGFVPNFEFGRNVNQRVRYSKTIFDDGTYADEALSSFDGLGHYRTSLRGGNNPNGGNTLTTLTNFNPNRGTFTVASNGTPSGNFTMVPVGSPWILGTYDKQQATEGSQTSTVATCFDANGFLTGRRAYTTFGSAPSLQDTDLLSIFTVDANGNVVTEQYLGGDDTGTEVDASTTDTCLSSSSTANYRIDHTYSAGTRRRSFFRDGNGSPVSHFILDTDIDANTGLVSARRAASTVGASGVTLNEGLKTDFEYDSLGRLNLEKPATTTNRKAQNRIEFSSNATTVDVFEEDSAGTTLRKRTLALDGLGRVKSETRALPSTSATAFRTWEYDALGRITALSAWGNQTPAVMTHYEYDHLGRVSAQTAPDGSVTTFDFTGARLASVTSSVRTSLTADPQFNQFTNATTTTEYDGKGRAVKVTEASDAVTTYSYDVADRLIAVCADKTAGVCTQERSFEYDNRGFLTEETHPELGSAGNGSTTYLYDSRGNVVRKTTGAQLGDFDVRMAYDRSGRPLRIFEARTTDGVNRDLKLFEYESSNSGSDYRNGQLTRAVRYNWIAAAGANVQVIEDYNYDGREGVVRTRRTFDSECVGTAAVCNELLAGEEKRDFTQGFVQDALGNTVTIEQPTCKSPGTAPCKTGSTISTRTVTNSYDKGWLSSVTWTGAAQPATLAYYDNGMVSTVTHANTVLDQILLDSDRIPRPNELKTTNVIDPAACVPPAFTTHPQSQSITSGTTATLAAKAVGQNGQTISYIWYRGAPLDRSAQLGGGTLLGDGSTQFTTPALTVDTSYWVEATNGCGATASITAVISVCTAPVVEFQPFDKEITRTQVTDLSVIPEGSGPFTYQWYEIVGGVAEAISGATGQIAYVAPNGTTQYKVSISNGCDSVFSDTVTVTVHEPPTAPGALVATSNGTSNTISWTASSSFFQLIGYEVQRQDGLVQDVYNGQLTATNGPSGVTPGTAYLYRVRARDENGVAGPWSVYDLTTAIAFANDPLQAGVTPVNGSDVGQLRQAIDAVRTRAGLSPAWTSHAAETGIIYSGQIVEMRARFNEARGVLGLPLLTFTDPLLTPEQSPIRTVHIQELRNGVK
jgi:YD repeat-containing protein